MHDSPIDLYLDMSTSSSFVDFAWTPSAFIRITVGGSHPNFSRLLDGLLHETMELSFRLMRCHYRRCGSLNDISTSTYTFHCEHSEFETIVRHAADMLAFATDNLRKVWNKERKS